EIVCSYKGENYSVREDGSVLRPPRAGKKLRPNDNQWTFGKQNNEKGYMEIASVPVHRIVTTAFHGEAPYSGHVVDHIDTNKCNNRPENLRWVTKFENIMLNPITVKKIEWIIGDKIEAFLADPAKFRDKFKNQSFAWMRLVSAEEGQRTLERLQNWAKSDKKPSGGSLGEWIYNRYAWQEATEAEPAEMVIVSKTPGAVQQKWKTVSEFPGIPQGNVERSLIAYEQNLTAGMIFCRNEKYTTIVVKTGFSNDGRSLFVITESKGGMKPWALAEITYEDDLFVHTSLGTFFEERGAERAHTEALGLEWTGVDGIDDWS
ncbi:MAG: HNH endonuclease signature motif containing protein, partial [Chitinophagales bacterium]